MRRVTAALLAAWVGLAVSVEGGERRPRVSKAARSVIEKAVQSMGGDAALAGIKGARIKTRGNYKVGAMELPFTAETLYLAPDRMLWKLDAGDFKATSCCDGDMAWSQWMAHPARLKGAMKESVCQYPLQLQVFFVRPLLELKDVSIGGGRAEELNGKTVHRLRLREAKGKRFVATFGAGDAPMLLSLEGDMTHLDGRKGRFKADYAAPKRFGEITVPSVSEVQTFAGGKLAETIREEIVSIELNPVVGNEAFAMPKLSLELGKAIVKKTIEGRGLSLLHAGPYDRMAQTMETLTNAAREAGLMEAGPFVAIYLNDPNNVKDPSELRTEIILPLEAIGPAPEKLPKGVSLKMLPAQDVASVTCRGPYGQADVKALRDLFGWIPANGYEIAGPPQILYFHNPSGTVEEDLVSEVQIPVLKK